MEPIGRVLVVAGLVLVGLGALLSFGALSWLGRLPGDFRVERPGFKLYVPITTSILISIVLSLVLYLVSRLRR